jgi:hypothetical protein
MTRKHILFFSLPLFLLFISGKDPMNSSSTYTVYINYTDHSVRAQVLKEPGKTHPEKGHFYYWYMNNNIKMTDGGFDGKLLHGTYKSFYRDLSLMEQGEFVHGEKSGEWISWYENGHIHEVSHYKNGLLSGKYELYNEDGSIKERSEYSKGELNGDRILIEKGLPDSVIHYKHGSIAQQKYSRKKKSLATKDSIPPTLKKKNDTAQADSISFAKKFHKVFSSGQNRKNKSGKDSLPKKDSVVRKNKKSTPVKPK